MMLESQEFDKQSIMRMPREESMVRKIDVYEVRMIEDESMAREEDISEKFAELASAQEEEDIMAELAEWEAEREELMMPREPSMPMVHIPIRVELPAALTQLLALQQPSGSWTASENLSSFFQNR